MTKIAYDPVKDRFANIIRRSKSLRIIFYFLLDLFFLRSWHLRRLLREKGKVFDKSGPWKVLDAGSGFGQYDYFLLRHFNQIQITSVDIKNDYLDDNKVFFENEIKEGRISFEFANLLDIKSEKKYDLVLCVDVLEHIEDDVKVINNLSAMIKSDGYFLMHSPSHLSSDDAEEDDSFVGEHARTGYSKAEIEKKLMEADLLPVKTKYTYGKAGKRGWALSVKYPMILFNKIGWFAVIPLLIYYPVVLPLTLILNFADLYTRNRLGNGIYALARKIQ